MRCRNVLTERRSSLTIFNPLESRGNYIAISNNMKSVHWPLMGWVLHLVQWGGYWAGSQPAQAPPRCTKCNSPPINGQCTNTILLYDGPLLCGFNIPIKGLKSNHTRTEQNRFRILTMTRQCLGIVIALVSSSDWLDTCTVACQIRRNLYSRSWWSRLSLQQRKQRIWVD